MAQLGAGSPGSVLTEPSMWWGVKSVADHVINEPRET